MTRRIEEESQLARWSRRKSKARDETVVAPRGAATPVADDAATTPATIKYSSVSTVPGAEGPAMPWMAPLASADETDDKPVGVYEPMEEGDVITEEDREVAEKMGLPDIENLAAGSNFKPFLADGVPQIMKRMALRKLWATNPAFAVLDGLNDYDENFRVTNVLIDAAATTYRVGKGYFTDEELEAKRVADAEKTARAEAAKAEANKPDEAEAAADVEPESAEIAENDTDDASEPAKNTDQNNGDDDDELGDGEDDLV